MKNCLKIFIIFIIIFSFTSCSAPKKEDVQTEEVKGVWISVYDMAEFKGISEGGFRAKCKNMFINIKEKGFNNVFLHVRAMSDALYRSQIFPWSKFISGEEGVSPGYDPLEIFLQTAHENGLKLHAWINPYRISNTSSDIEKLSLYHPAVKMYEENKSDIFFSTKGIYYNPASERAQNLILDGVREIVENYDIDGIHIDDFFYPTDSEEIDKNEYASFIENGGTQTLKEFRLKNVSKFVSEMYKIAKTKDKNIIVSISPSADIEADYNVHFADVKKWMSDSGYCDWMIPQVYYGMKNETKPYKETVDLWCKEKKNKNVKVIIGLAAYKSGELDTYAGSGIYEWQENADILSNQIKYLRKKNCNGFSLFSYSSIAVPNPQMQEELENLKEVI